MKFREYLQSAGVITALIITAYSIEFLSDTQILTSFFPLTNGHSAAVQFEYSFWQFLFGMVGIIIVSRGNLWRYGICSDNFYRSMKYLAIAYVITMCATAAGFLLNSPAQSVESIFQVISIDSIFDFLNRWMAFPVADQVLFFGLTQTVIAKNLPFQARYWPFPIRLEVIIAATIFAIFHTSLNTTLFPQHQWIISFLIGIFSGSVYASTRSLLTPMLAQAFFYGFPALIVIWRQ